MGEGQPQGAWSAGMCKDVCDGLDPKTQGGSEVYIARARLCDRKCGGLTSGPRTRGVCECTGVSAGGSFCRLWGMVWSVSVDARVHKCGAQ